MVSPADLKIYQISAVEITDPSLPTLVKSATYRIEAVPPETFPPDLAERLQNLLATESLIRQRSKKTYDLRPLIYALDVINASAFRAELALGEGTTGRPHELLDALGFGDFSVRIHRETMHLKG